MVVLQVGAAYVAAAATVAGAQEEKERHDTTQKNWWVPVSKFSFCKIFIPSCAFI
jgi:hypothetical protein